MRQGSYWRGLQGDPASRGTEPTAVQAPARQLPEGMGEKAGSKQKGTAVWTYVTDPTSTCELHNTPWSTIGNDPSKTWNWHLQHERVWDRTGVGREKAAHEHRPEGPWGVGICFQVPWKVPKRPLFPLAQPPPGSNHWTEGHMAANWQWIVLINSQGTWVLVHLLEQAQRAPQWAILEGTDSPSSIHQRVSPSSCHGWATEICPRPILNEPLRQDPRYHLATAFITNKMCHLFYWKTKALYLPVKSYLEAQCIYHHWS